MSGIDRYSANSYTRGGLGHRSTVEAARSLLNGDAGYVFDTRLHRIAIDDADGRLDFGLTIQQWIDYLADARPTDRDEAHLIDHLTATGDLPEEWVTHSVHPQAEC